MTVLHHTVVRGGLSKDKNLCVLVHGILGAGMNLRSIARRLHELHPEFWFVLPDLRGHGSSWPGMSPHTVDSCAEDISNLEFHLGQEAICRIGHSFGGKVVLSLLKRAPVTTVLMDTLPGSTAPGDSSRQWMDNLLDTLSKVPVPLQQRKDLGSHLGEYGARPQFVAWMGTNLKPIETGGFGWKFSLPTIRKLIQDYWEQDCLHLVGSNEGTHLLYGEHSGRFTPEEINGLKGPFGGRLHVIPKAGHWLHADNPEATLNSLSSILHGL